MSDQNQPPPKIEFPCPDYPIKVMGDSGPELRQLVIDVFTRHAADFNERSITVRDSSKGTFQSLTVTIEATGEAQLQAIFDDLKTNKMVKMVL